MANASDPALEGFIAGSKPGTKHAPGAGRRQADADPGEQDFVLQR